MSEDLVCDWICCIARRPSSYMTWCGRYVYDFLFQNLEHALMAEEQGSRLSPCLTCVKLAAAERKRLELV